MTKKIDLSGKVFGRWQVLGQADATESCTHVRWICRCECGNESIVLGDSLRRGVSRSCGCLKREITSKVRKIHGMSKSSEYYSYNNMLERCFNPKNKHYKDYGEAGITVCAEFIESFENFYRELGDKPKDGQRWTLGRIDNNRGYEIGNVRWELDVQQARNHSLQKNNTSGIAGICIRHTEKDGDRVVARYNALDGTRVSKSFSVRRYGLQKAMELAKEWRKEMIARLNEMGADYAESHGTRKVVVND